MDVRFFSVVMCSFGFSKTITKFHFTEEKTVVLTVNVFVVTFSVELMNSQMLIKGIEITGCVLVAAGSTRILNRLHKPVRSKGELLNKKTWVGKVENLQVLTCSTS